jgi:GNAT superfamily N-acetyltransferase
MTDDNTLHGIRPALPADIDRLLAMCEAFLNATRYGGLLPFVEDRLRPFLGDLIDEGGAFVADVSAAPHWQQGADVETVVGMIGLKVWIHPFTGQVIAEEIAMWVEPNHRGGSLGPRLLTQAVRWARMKNAEMLRASAPYGKDKLGAFYERRGFSPIDTTYVKTLT